MYIIKLEEGVWIQHINCGDPGRTLVEENAQKFKTELGAHMIMARAKKMRPFKNAKVIEV